MSMGRINQRDKGNPGGLGVLEAREADVSRQSEWLNEAREVESHEEGEWRRPG